MARITSITKIENPEYVCDVTVADNHNLYARSNISESSILVHNCYDENYVFLKKLGFLNYTATKDSKASGYYALKNIGAQYSAFPYRQASFGKSQRKTIEHADLDDSLIEYGCNDVLLPFHLQREQVRRAKASGYDKYMSMVLDQESDKIHAFAEMEFNGIPTDLDYLFWLASEDSSVTKSIRRSYAALYDSKEARRLNRRLAHENNAPQQDMFGGASSILDFTKPEHRRKFFFEELGLKPLTHGKSGEGSLDSDFKEHYKDNPHVAAFEEIAKSEQLRNLFVNRFIEIYKEGGDIRKDGRIRPSFMATDVVTGRISERDPNMQQLPNRGLGPQIKRVFAAPPGHMILKCDYCITGDALIPTVDSGILELQDMEKASGGLVGGLGGPRELKGWVYSGKKSTLELTLKSGNRLGCTRRHEVLVVRAGKFKWVRAGSVRIGDYACFNRKRVIRKTRLTLNLKGPVLVGSNNTSGEWCITKTGSVGRPYKVGLTGDKSPWGKKVFATMEEAVIYRDDTCKKLGRPPNMSFAQVIKPTKMTPELAFILGCIASDGYMSSRLGGGDRRTVMMCNTDRSLLKKYMQCFKKVFGVRLKMKLAAPKGTPFVINGVRTASTKDIFRCSCSYRHVIDWLSELGVYGEGAKNGKCASHHKTVPWSVLQADVRSQSAFLAAYLECDGSADTVLRWYTVSPKMVQGLCALLNAQGEVTSGHFHRKGNTLRLGIAASNRVWKRIERYTVTKTLTKKAIVGNRRQVGYLPKAWVDNMSTKDQDLANTLWFSQVSSIRKSGVKPVYDLTMAKGEPPAFVANGMVVHNCAHEVRGWSLVSQDEVLGDVFRHGLKLRQEYMRNPTPELARRIFLEGDSHRLNVAYFFNKVLEETDEKELKTLRDQIKGVIFGLIYGMHNKTLAGNLKQDIKDVNKLVNKLFKRFKNGHRWLLDTEAQGEREGFVQSPLGRRRTLCSWLAHPMMEGYNTITSAANRKARNSPIQGFCSDLNFISSRNLLTRAWEERQKRGELTGAAGYQLMNVVHDSKESLVRYDWLWWALRTVHESMTADVERIVGERHGFKFAVPVEIDMELGASLAKTYKWDWSLSSLVEALASTFVYSQQELGHDVNPYKEMRRLFDNMDDAPLFLKKQYKNAKPKLMPSIAAAESALKISDYAKMRKGN